MSETRMSKSKIDERNFSTLTLKCSVSNDEGLGFLNKVINNISSEYVVLHTSNIKVSGDQGYHIYITILDASGGE